MRPALYLSILVSCALVLPCFSPTLSAVEITAVREIIKTADYDILSPGAVYPLDPDRILITDTAGRTVSCFDKDGKRIWKTDGTETGEPGFLFPGMIASSRGLNVFVIDSALRKIFKIDPRGAFTGYMVNHSVEKPACIAQGESGELYLYDNTTWELACVEPDGTQRWKVKPWKLTGEVTSIRLADGGIHLLVPGESAIYSYGKFGEFIRETRLVSPQKGKRIEPVAFWPARDGRTYVCSREGSVVIYDSLSNPEMSVDSLNGKKLEIPCDLFLSGNRMYLLDCGTQAVYEVTIR